MQIRLSKLNNILADYYGYGYGHFEGIPTDIFSFDEEYVFDTLNKMLPKECDEFILQDALADIFGVSIKNVKVDNIYIKTNPSFHSANDDSRITIKVEDTKHDSVVVLELFFDDMEITEMFK